MLLFDAIAGRRGFALALILLVAVGGYLRGMVVSEAFAKPPGFTLCHGAAGGTPAGDAVNHSCCDDCVLAAFAVEPAPTTLSLRAEVFADAGLGQAAVEPPTTRRAITPRQSQGPPRS